MNSPLLFRNRPPYPAVFVEPKRLPSTLRQIVPSTGLDQETSRGLAARDDVEPGLLK
ncbi:hypothetical protein A2U01_0078752 [Trifolium medium]|uniref:Uncharacterized protein n=1 Tax=Trifolium medium TaxID=97028 RepID=A0A392T8T4_9FABA|nr:hypothetical protein [Trifolium medium]